MFLDPVITEKHYEDSYVHINAPIMEKPNVYQLGYNDPEKNIVIIRHQTQDLDIIKESFKEISNYIEAQQIFAHKIRIVYEGYDTLEPLMPVLREFFLHVKSYVKDS